MNNLSIAKIGACRAAWEILGLGCTPRTERSYSFSVEDGTITMLLRSKYRITVIYKSDDYEVIMMNACKRTPYNRADFEVSQFCPGDWTERLNRELRKVQMRRNIEAELAASRA